MKRLALITHETYAKEKYHAQLKAFFGTGLEIISYAVNAEPISEMIRADVFLITTTEVTKDIRDFIPNSAEIVHISRTFDREKASRLNDIPVDSDILLLDYSAPFAWDTMSVLHEVGFKQFNYLVAEANMDAEQLPHYDYAISIGESPSVEIPKSKSVDIGWYCIDVLTYINIAEKLHLLNHEINRRIYSYGKKVLPTNMGIFNVVKYSWKMQHQWDAILDMIDDGVIVTDNQKNIIHTNDFIHKVFKKNGYGKKEDKMNILKSSLQRVIDDEKELINELVDIEETGKKLLISKRRISLYGDLNGYLILCRDVTEMQNLENRLRLIQEKKGFLAKYTFDDIITGSHAMEHCIEQGRRIAETDASVLVTGESGTGKELFAQSLHNASLRSKYPFVAVNCAALPTELLESELFGYEEGAFTGAKKGGKKGIFELAHQGTVFLDEIGEIPLSVQAKLLRVLEEKEVMRIGGDTLIPVNVRVISASNIDFEEQIKKKAFRSDLYYRLNVMEIMIPPLRERMEDIALLVRHFLSQDAEKAEIRLDSKLIEKMSKIYWEGNVRELRNCVEYMKIMGGNVLTIEDLPSRYKKVAGVHLPAEQFAEEKDDSWTEYFFREEHELVEAILKIMKIKPLGRRRLHSILQKQGFDATEHKVRTILKRMSEVGLIEHSVEEQ